MSSYHGSYAASNCVDGDIDTMCQTNQENMPWIALEYKEPVTVNQVLLYNRNTDETTALRLRNVEVILTNTKPDHKGTFLKNGHTFGKFKGPAKHGQEVIIHNLNWSRRSLKRFMYVVIVLRTPDQQDTLNMMEVQNFGYPGLPGIIVRKNFTLIS